MNESQHPLTAQTLARLAKIAEGNGPAAKSIELVETHEETYVVEAQLHLTPSFDVQARSYAGAVKGKDCTMLPGFTALQDDVNARRQSYQESTDWLPEAVKEIREAPGYGWGQDGGKIALPGHKAKLAANEKCPACQGSGLLTCQQCQGRTYIECPYCFGRGEENCYNCFAKGVDPVNPQIPCSVCRGTRLAPCRYCHGTGRLPCPTCQGRGGTPCPHCQGSGSLTQEVSINAGVTVHFAVQGGTHLPSALVRGLDRLGMTNLAKGHADFELIEPDEKAPSEEKTRLMLKAKIPFAEMKLRLNGRPVMGSAFGKRGLIAGLPPFLDESLRPWREALTRAAMGHPTFDKALEARLIRDTLKLELSGKGTVKALRQLYSIGLSPKTAEEILKNTVQALHKFTLRSRIAVAAVSLLASAGLFAGLFLTPLHQLFAHRMSSNAWLLVQAFLPVLAIGLSGYAFSHAARWVLQRRFPGLPIRLGQKIGAIGYGTLVGILATYGIVVAMMKASF